MSRSRTLRAFRAAFWLGIAGLPLWLAGCKGIPIKSEQQARQDLAMVGKVYHPQDKRPILPALTTESSLDDFLLYAMLNNPQVEAAYYDWAASVESITVARSRPDPKFTFQSDIAKVIMTAMPGLMQEFPGPGKLLAAGNVASAESQTKYFAFEKATLETVFALKKAYYQLWFLDDKIRIDRETLELLNKLEQIARAKNEVGKVTLQDVYRAQLEQDQLTTEIANLQDSRHSLLAQFKGALGLGHDQPDPPVPSRFATTPLDLSGDQLLATAFARNPRLQAMQAEVRSAQAAIALARKSKIPDFSLGLMADALATPPMFRPEAGVSLPIWRDKIAAQIQAAQAGKQAAEARLSSEEIMLTVDFAMKSYDYREVTRNLALLENQLIPKARISLEIAQAGYLAGTIDFFNLIDAQRALLNFQLQEVGARTRREVVLADLSLSIAGIAPAGAPFLKKAAEAETPTPSSVPVENARTLNH